MLKKAIRQILEDSRQRNWVLEPDAKKILKLSQIPVPAGKVVQSEQAAVTAARRLGFPLVAKAVGDTIIHKSDLGGVITGIKDPSGLRRAYRRLTSISDCRAVLVEVMGQGIELIAGGKIDAQFGPVVLLGMGGTAVEIYNDTALRMAPLSLRDVDSMIGGLKASQLLTGFRGRRPVNLKALKQTLINFSKLLVKMQDYIESVDLNPILCNPRDCVVADARIMLPPKATTGSLDAANRTATNCLSPPKA